MKQASARTALLSALLGIISPVACADTLLSADFQNGTTAGWVAMRNGDVALSTYAGNVSLRIKKGGEALTAIPTSGFSGVTIVVAFAASSLGSDCACIADATFDGGQTWSEVHRVSQGEDDAVTLHAGGKTLPMFSDRQKVILRLRTVASEPGATCWADNIRITASSTTSLPSETVFDANGGRLILGSASLLDARSAPSLVNMAAFTPPAGAIAPSNKFEGRLVLGKERRGGGLRALRDDYKNAADDSAKHLPPFDFAFVQVGDSLIPVQRGAIASSHPMWEFILEPGRVWDEPGDKGYSRASLPFTLEERNANCMHNGVLTFLFRNDGAISDVAFQIASETCLYFKFDLWGRSAARYVPGAVPQAAGVTSAYRKEIAERMPEKPIAALANDHPGAVAGNFGSPVEIDPADMTTFGVVLGGVNYRGSCATRLGPYPYCEEMDLPSYSFAKSIFAGLGMMRLALLYPDIVQQSVATFVPECASVGTWSDVTFGNMLDMASGHYSSDRDQADEDAADIESFFDSSDHAGRIRFACTHYPRKADPGTKWVYHTADTYVLGTAFNAYYRSKGGRDVYRDLLVPLWHQLQLNPAIDVTRRSYDAVSQPFTGWGLTLHTDDVAKLASFVAKDRGALAGKPVVDSAMLNAALQRDPKSPGLRASTDAFRYHNGFWAWNAAGSLGCKSPAWIPFMSGFGGNVVALMPNGLVYYYFSDGGTYSWASAAAEANRIKSFCEK